LLNWAIDLWIILHSLVHTGYIQILAIFHYLIANGHGFLIKTPISTTE